MKKIIVYGGRFQPFHIGHKSSYDHLAEKFGGDVFIASAEKPPGPKDPFTWAQKKKLAVSLGVPSSKFVKVKNVYNLAFLKEVLPIDDDTVVILAMSEKDSDRLISKNVDKQGYALKKNGERQAIQRYPKNDKKLSTEFTYAYITPTVDFKVAGKSVTGATQIRDMYAKANDKKRQRMIVDLYGKVTPALKKMFDSKLGTLQTESYLREHIEFINNF